MNEVQVIKAAEAELWRVGQRHTRQIKARVIQLIHQLNTSKVVRLTGLIMGMGGWAFTGDEVEVVYYDNSQGTVSVQDFFYWADSPGKMIYTPKGATKKTIKQAQDILQCLYYLTENRYHDTFDLTAKELRA